MLDKIECREEFLISLKYHIRGIAEYFYSTKHMEVEVGNWFWMASSIDQISFDGIRYDSAFEMCSSAHEYEIEKNDLHEKLMNELTLFLYVYSGFESLLNKIELNDCHYRKGKINSATFFIKENFSIKYNTIPKYRETLSLLRELVNKSALSDFEKYFCLDECTDANGVGIKVVYKLRNCLAHGDYSFPEPNEWFHSFPLEPEITKLCTRILLFSIQMLLIADCENPKNIIELFNSEVIERNNDGEFMIAEYDFLNYYHLKKMNKRKNQISLF